MKIRLPVVVILLLIPTLVLALDGMVVKVKDGDTVVIAPDGGGAFFVCRLYGIDAPERSGQSYGEEATLALKRMILGELVDVETTGAKTYNREVCKLRRKRDRLDVNLTMVTQGHAWAYRKYLKRPYASEYIEAEEGARKNKQGLWHDTNPTPPWEFRAMKRRH
ncbi:MAG: thermonuclease family protein [Thermodesulfovibrionales bacterium]